MVGPQDRIFDREGVAGAYTKILSWERSQKEDGWIHAYYRVLTGQVIKFCLQHGCQHPHKNLSELRERDMESEF